MRPAAHRGISRDRAVPSASLAAAPGGIGDVASLALAAFAAGELDEYELARCLGTWLGARAWRVVHRMERGALALSPGKTWLTFKFADDGASHAHAAALRTLATQLERAAVRRGHLEADRNELEALRMAIDLFAPAVLIVDATLAVVFASDAACEQFGDGGSLRLVLSDGAAFAAIGPLVVAACAGGVPSGLLLVRLGARAIGALVMPVASGLAVLVLSDVHQPRLPDHEALRIHEDVTPIAINEGPLAGWTLRAGSRRGTLALHRGDMWLGTDRKGRVVERRLDGPGDAESFLLLGPADLRLLRGYFRESLGAALDGGGGRTGLRASPLSVRAGDRRDTLRPAPSPAVRRCGAALPAVAVPGRLAV